MLNGEIFKDKLLFSLKVKYIEQKAVPILVGIILGFVSIKNNGTI